ncbi:MAG: uracil-DNA glycosylase [Anaerolineales bacterium]|nr:uracil-DNA glycosylase [Anaerolineales bacterium]
MKSDEILAKVAEEVQVCTKCDLHFSRKNGVPGEGPISAEIMFIGEGPGFHENEQGRPFVGPAGQFLDELLGQVGMQRGDVFIGNVVKCRPPGNRDPRPEELAACDFFLEQQIQTINPKVIVTLGRFSMGKFIPNAKISEVHGLAMRVKGRLIVPMYHPAAALHQPSLRPVVENDFAQLPDLIASAESAPEYEVETPEEKTEPKQLSMF